MRITEKTAGDAVAALAERLGLPHEGDGRLYVAGVGGGNGEYEVRRQSGDGGRYHPAWRGTTGEIWNACRFMQQMLDIQQIARERTVRQLPAYRIGDGHYAVWFPINAHLQVHGASPEEAREAAQAHLARLQGRTIDATVAPAYAEEASALPPFPSIFAECFALDNFPDGQVPLDAVELIVGGDGRGDDAEG